MAENYKAVIQLAANSGLPRDASENTLYFQWASTATNTQLDGVASDIETFWNGTSGTGRVRAVGGYLAKDRDYTSGACKVVWYHMPSSAGPTGSPVHVSTFTLTDPGSVTNLPEQDAVCNSYHASLAGVFTHQGRYKGRFFIGPLNTHSLESGGVTVAAQSVNSDMMNDVILSTVRLASDVVSVSALWVQHSRVDWAFRTVTGGYVDDRFDTQRRRLQESSGRLTW